MKTLSLVEKVQSESEREEIGLWFVMSELWCDMEAFTPKCLNFGKVRERRIVWAEKRGGKDYDSMRGGWTDGQPSTLDPQGAVSYTFIVGVLVDGHFSILFSFDKIFHH